MNVKKVFISVFGAVLFLFTNSLIVNAKVYDKFEYEICGNEITITKYLSFEPAIIPNYIEGYPVTKIGYAAFCSGNEGFTQSDNTILVPCCYGITIPKTVTKIGKYAIGYDKIITFVPSVGDVYNYHKHDNLIRGYKGTAAEIYAKENGFTFVALDDNPEVTTATTMTTQTTTTSTTVSTTATSKATSETTKATTSTTTSSTTITTNSTTTISTSSSTSGSTTLSTTSTSIDTTTNLTTPLTTTSTSETTPITTTHVKGDANGDNKLDVRDAAFIAQKIVLDKAAELPKCADFNDDGTVNVRDAAAIARFLSSRKS